MLILLIIILVIGFGAWKLLQFLLGKTGTSTSVIFANIKQASSESTETLNKRVPLVDQLIDIIGGYIPHDQQVMVDVITARDNFAYATGGNEKYEASILLSKALKAFFSATNNYPNLIGDQNFLLLKNELEAIEKKITFVKWINTIFFGVIVSVVLFAIILLLSNTYDNLFRKYTGFGREADILLILLGLGFVLYLIGKIFFGIAFLRYSFIVFWIKIYSYPSVLLLKVITIVGSVIIIIYMLIINYITTINSIPREIKSMIDQGQSLQKVCILPFGRAYVFNGYVVDPSGKTLSMHTANYYDNRYDKTPKICFDKYVLIKKW